MTKTMLTKNTEKLRQEVAAHVAADSIIQGVYWDSRNEKGCFFGCLAQSDNPRLNETMYGLPVMVQRIAENIFEALPENEAKAFFAAFPDAVGCDGKDLTKVSWQFLASELRSLPKQPVDIQAVIDPVIAGMDLLASGKEWPAADAKAARDAARAAARAAGCAADAVADAAGWAAGCAAGAAVAAVEAAVWAVEVAVEAAAEAAVGAAVADARLRQRDLLLRLISEAPVIKASPMTNLFRALCARMADKLDHYRQLLKLRFHQ